MIKPFVLTDDGKRIYCTEAEIADGDAFTARFIRWRRDVEEQRQAFQREADALRERVIARAVIEGMDDDDD